jgi:hypothetical protein
MVTGVQILVKNKILRNNMMKKVRFLIFLVLLYASCTNKISGAPDFTTTMNPSCYYINNSIVYSSSRYPSHGYREIAIPIYGGTKEPVYEDDIIKHQNSLKLGTKPLMPLLHPCFQDRGNLDLEAKNLLRFYDEKGFIHAEKPDFFVWENGLWIMYYNIIKADIKGYFSVAILPVEPTNNSLNMLIKTNPFDAKFDKKGWIRLSINLGGKIPTTFNEIESK